MRYKRYEQVVIAIVGICVAIFLWRWAWQAIGYERFSSRIASADRIVVSDGRDSITITGKAVSEIVRAVASAHRDAGHYRAKFSFMTSFYRGTNSLGEVDICSELFMAGGFQYRAEDDALKTLIVTPFMQKIEDEMR
jgi:hypothetical protein